MPKTAHTAPRTSHTRCASREIISSKAFTYGSYLCCFIGTTFSGVAVKLSFYILLMDSNLLFSICWLYEFSVVDNHGLIQIKIGDIIIETGSFIHFNMQTRLWYEQSIPKCRNKTTTNILGQASSVAS